jgi:hypothetical protein
MDVAPPDETRSAGGSAREGGQVRYDHSAIVDADPGTRGWSKR